MKIEDTIRQIIEDRTRGLGRPDLFRSPLVAFVPARDERFAGLKKIIGEWHITPEELLPGAESVISYFVPFTKQVVAQPGTVKEGSPLWSEAYQEINRHFNVINEAVTRFLEEQGFRAASVRPTHTYDPADLKCFWSHRSVAAIAGLGCFGANRLVITPKGSGGRFCSVVTSAVLEPDTQPDKVRCLYLKNKNACGLCFKACPVHALHPESMDKFVCQDELNKNERLLRESTELTSADTCGKCISVCPLAFIE